MLNKLLDDLKDHTSAVAGQFIVLLLVGMFGLVTLGFLTAAGFIYVADKYGALNACLAGAGTFLVAALIAVIIYAARKSSLKRKPARPQPKSPLQAALSDPMVIATALQATRMIGVKRLLPLLVIGGLAFGLYSKRPATDEEDE
jgi:uncharacterized oligopeptide transporter (OPT) family protein